MKKKLIAIVGAISMVASMSMMNVASAGTVDVNYDAVTSTPSTAVYELYAKNYANAGTVSGLQIVINLDETIVDLTTFSSNVASYTSEPQSAMMGSATPSVTTKRSKTYKISWTNTGGISWDETQPIAIVSMPLLSNAGYNPTVTTTIKVDGATDAATINVEPILVQTATVAGTTISEDAASEAATYFKVTNAPLAGTAYWYADFDGTAKKLAANVPNTVGTADLGLVYTGADAPTSVKIVCE